MVKLFNFRRNNQFTLVEILLLWSLSSVPMAILAFYFVPWVLKFSTCPAPIVFWIAALIGLIWQTVLSVLILKAEGHALTLKTFRERLKYQKPIHPQTGIASYWLLLWVIPFVVFSALIQSGSINLPDVDNWLNPLIEHVPKYDLSSLNTNEFKGAWWLLILGLITVVFNYLLGEELFYRGILLPKMNGVFGKWDWLANGVLFGFYHLHKPQIIISTALYFGFVFALPVKIFQSTWMAVIIHGLEGLLLIVVLLGVILGY